MISIRKINDLKKLSVQGLSMSILYEGIYKDAEVVVKAQRPGSLEKTDPADDRFLQEKKTLELNLSGVVDYYGEGNDFDGERFIVIEKLYPIDLSIADIQVEANNILLTARQLFLYGFDWTAVYKHVMMDRFCKLKLIDFNDINHPRKSFFDDHFIHNPLPVIRQLAKEFNLNPESVQEKAIYNLLEKEYQSLENVHEPIYFKPYDKIYKRATEPGDNYILRPANRECIKRGQQLLSGVNKYLNKSSKVTCLDIGSNVGWFTFLFQEAGLDTTGVDFDINYWGSDRTFGWPIKTGGKIEFCQLLADKFGSEASFKNVNADLEYVRGMSEYDIIIALSILHLYFTQHKVTANEWKTFVKQICLKAKHVFIFEVSAVVFNNLQELKDFNDLGEYVRKLGGFKTVKILGISDAKRPLIMCER